MLVDVPKEMALCLAGRVWYFIDLEGRCFFVGALSFELGEIA